MSSQQPVDFDDVQGLVRFAHGRLQASVFLLLRVADAALAKDWLAAAPVTTASSGSAPPDQALQVAFTAAGLEAFGLGREVMGQFSREFLNGMSGDGNRSRRLGDTGSNDPRTWSWGQDAQNVPHVLLMLYALPARIDTFMVETRDARFMQAFTVLTELASVQRSSEEPFGFADGISQPRIDWEQMVTRGLHGRDAYGNRLALGEILLGYRNEYDLYTSRPVLDPSGYRAAAELPQAEDQPGLRDLGRNGTYLVFRQLAQDVRGFWRHIDSQAGGDAAQRERIASAMVGRRRDGRPLLEPGDEAIDGSDPAERLNHFTYAGDPHGHQCPIGAHVRRANPRTGDFPTGVTGILTRLVRTLGFGRRHDGDDLVASTRFHRLLRRGRVYGTELSIERALADAPADANAEVERGLHFVCLCANISRQFEFVQNAWIASPKFAGLATESDPLLGNRQPLLNGQLTDEFTMPRAGAPAQCLHGLPQFVTVRGGAYFFMPGMRALHFIVRR